MPEFNKPQGFAAKFLSKSPFKKNGGSGMGAKQRGDELKKELSEDKRTVGGRHTEIHDGKTVKPSYRDKMKQIERHLKEFKEGGATDAEVKTERERLVDDLKKHVGK